MVFALAFILLVQTGNVKASTENNNGLANSPWPKFMHDSQNTGQSRNIGAQDNQVLWETSLFSGRSPIVGPDNTIYVVTGPYYLDDVYKADLYALVFNGTIKWKLENYGTCVPALASDGTLYVGSLDNKVCAINSDGTLKASRQFSDEIRSPITIATDKIYVVAGTTLYALDLSLNHRWSYHVGWTSDLSVAVGPDGAVFVHSFDGGYLYAIASDGMLKWGYQIGSGYISPSVAFDGTIYVGGIIADNGWLYALKPDGTLKWRYSVGNWVGTPAIAFDGTIYVGATDKFYAINPNGMLKWAFNAGTILPPSIGFDGAVYFISYEKLYALNSNGALKWSYDVKTNLFSSPVIGADGTLYIGGLKAWGGFYVDVFYSFFSPPPPSQPITLADSPWPKFMNNVRNTGRSAYAGPEDNHLRWSADLVVGKGTYTSNSSPVVGSDGTIYIRSQSYTPSGEMKWGFDLHVHGAPALGSDGTVYFGTWTIGENVPLFYAVHPDGTIKWIFTPSGEIWKSPTIAQDGTIYFGDDNGKFYALNLNGTLKWVYQTGRWIASSPAIDTSGNIYFTSGDGHLYALNPDGTTRWSYLLQASASSPSIADDGTIYIGSADGTLYAINPNGSQNWTFQTDKQDWVQSVPAIATDGTIYFSIYNTLYALNPDGSLKWIYVVENLFEWGYNYIPGSPVVDENGSIYFSSNGGVFYALNPDGSLKWRYAGRIETGGPSPAISKNHVIYFATDEQLYAFGPEPEPSNLRVTPQYFVIGSKDSLALTVSLISNNLPLDNKLIIWRVQENWQWRENVTTYTNSQGKATFTYTPLVSSTPASVTIQASFVGDEQFAENSASSGGVIIEQLPRLRQGLYRVGTELSYNYYSNEQLVGQFVCRIPDTEIRDGIEYLKVLVDSWMKTGYENCRGSAIDYVRWGGEQMEYGHSESSSYYHDNTVIEADYDYASQVITLSGTRNASSVAPYTVSMNNGPFPAELWLFEFSTKEVTGKQILLQQFSIGWGGFSSRSCPLNVENTEIVTVPAGSFECYRLVDELGASWWVTVNGGMLVKYQWHDTTLELTSYKLPTLESAGSHIVAIAALLAIAVYLAGMARLLSASNKD